MRVYLSIVVLVFFSSSIIAGTIGEEYEAKQIKKYFFDIDGNETTPSAKSFCWESGYEETNNSVAVDSKTDEYSAAKVLYHVYYILCVEKSIRVGIRYTTPEQEKKFCDKASFDADVANTLAKLKMINKPSSGKFSNVDLNNFVKSIELTQVQQPLSCAKYAQRPGSAKILVNGSGYPLNFPNPVDDSSRSNPKERAENNPSDINGVSGKQK